jgi:hypothetical protein
MKIKINQVIMDEIDFFYKITIKIIKIKFYINTKHDKILRDEIEENKIKIKTNKEQSQE